MIYINLEGRLGNNLWQIAAAATLADRLGESFCAVPNRYYHCPEPDNCNFVDYIQPFKSTISVLYGMCLKQRSNITDLCGSLAINLLYSTKHLINERN